MLTDLTKHKIRFSNSTDLWETKDETVDLVVTSPPYPMIEMWDDLFGTFSSEITNLLREQKGKEAFEAMHRILDRVWNEVYRVLKKGGIACINVGDATRSMNGVFRLYSSHARIISYCSNLGFDVLPGIIWRKTTNSPTKFMGSGMLPGGAYVTLEHEHVLILRKGRPSGSPSNEYRQLRRESAYFWEERNEWFSDLWTSLPGVRQESPSNGNRRTAAFPFELAYRLINMFSVKGSTVLDPFLGTGTTVLAAIASARNSIGIEYDKTLSGTIDRTVMGSAAEINRYIKNRIEKHADFMAGREKLQSKRNYLNEALGMQVVTNQEREMKFQYVDSVKKDNSGYIAHYRDCRV